ncbi:MAG TPA: hypothetical protein VF950_12525 [Planctomycetota bacterium]
MGARPEDLRLLKALSRSCAAPHPAPSRYLLPASLAFLAVAALIAAARWLL